MHGQQNIKIRSRVAGVATKSGIRIPSAARTFFQTVQTGFGAHPASCSGDSGVLAPGVKRVECEVCNSPPSTVGVKNEWSLTSFPLYIT